MAISPHLRRKLREQLGTDAGDDLAGQLERMDPILAEIAQLRSDMQLGFARVDARFAAMEGSIATLDAKWVGQLAEGQARLETLIEKGLREQTRFFFLAWSVLLAAIVGLY